MTVVRDRFTKGQWKIFYQRDSDHPSVYAADGRAILSSGHARNRTLDERIANCTLAAAAPEMLHMLRVLQAVGVSGYMDEINKVIGKATGIDAGRRAPQEF